MRIMLFKKLHLLYFNNLITKHKYTHCLKKN